MNNLVKLFLPKRHGSGFGIFKSENQLHLTTYPRSLTDQSKLQSG